MDSESNMKTMWSDQYKKGCVVVEAGDTLDEIIEKAKDNDAFYFDGEDECFVISFEDKPERLVGPELYTEEALRRSFKAENAE